MQAAHAKGQKKDKPYRPSDAIHVPDTLHAHVPLVAHSGDHVPVPLVGAVPHLLKPGNDDIGNIASNAHEDTNGDFAFAELIPIGKQFGIDTQPCHDLGVGERARPWLFPPGGFGYGHSVLLDARFVELHHCLRLYEPVEVGIGLALGRHRVEVH